MNTRLLFEPKAQFEFIDAFQYYQDRRPGLGDEFELAVEDAYLKIQHAPNAYPATVRGARKLRVRGFPYNVIYSPQSFGIVIVSVCHDARNPNVWINRVPP